MAFLMDGIICDICGNYLSENGPYGHAIGDANFFEFTVKNVPGYLFFCHHGDCEQALHHAVASNDFHLLPDGPMRRVFLAMEKQQCDLEAES